MTVKVDLSGKAFGNWTVIEQSENRRVSVIYWRCVCICGAEKDVESYSLRAGLSTGCGCERIARLKARNTKHGQRNHRLYNIWRGMLGRCYYQRHKWYGKYGGRLDLAGNPWPVTVCAEWLHDFQAFFTWAMANGYEDTLTVDRRDNDLGYSPSNCRWATYTEQNQNRRMRPRATKKDCVVA